MTGGWRWGTPQSFSWVTALSLMILLETGEYIEKLGLKRIYEEANTRLEEIRTTTIDREELIEREKKIVLREEQALTIGRTASLVLILSIVPWSMIHLVLIAPGLREFLEQMVLATVASWVSFILIPILLLAPLPLIIYYWVKGYIERKQIFSYAKWLLSLIVVPILLVIILELIK